MLFTFRRDADGRETIHVGDVAIARTNDGPESFEWLASPPAGITAEHVLEASVMADEALFWHEVLLDWYTNEVTVDVPIVESTVLSITNEDDQA